MVTSIGCAHRAALEAAVVDGPRGKPTIAIDEEQTQVLVEQTAAVAMERLGALVGHLSRTELEALDSSLRLDLGLD